MKNRTLLSVVFLLVLAGPNPAGEVDSLIRAAPAGIPGADALVLLDRVQVSFDAGSSRTLERHFLVKVFTAQGRKDLQQMSVPFDPAAEKCEVRLAQVYTPDGKTTTVGTSLPIRFGDVPNGSVLEIRSGSARVRKGEARHSQALNRSAGICRSGARNSRSAFPKARNSTGPAPSPRPLTPNPCFLTCALTLWASPSASAGPPAGIGAGPRAGRAGS